MLNTELVSSEVLFVEIILRKKKWFICRVCNPSKSSIMNFTYNIGKTLDSYIGNYDNFFVGVDFNSEISESSMYESCSIYNLHNLCDKATCYKNQENPSCTDLFLTNSPRSFHNMQTIEICLSDFHRLVVTVLKIYLPKEQPKIITYREYKIFDNKCFLEESLFEMDKLGSLTKNIEMFQNVCINVLDKYALEKQKYVRANQANFMSTEINYAITIRSKS